VNPKLEGVDTAVVLGESGGVGCSSGLIDCSISRSLHSHLSSIATCCGDSCRFPVIGEGCDFDQLGGPSLLTSSLSSVRGYLGNGVVRMGGIRGRRDDEATGGEDFESGESSFHFPVTGDSWILFHSSGVDLLTSGSSSIRGYLGSKGVVRLGVMETIRGSCDEDATGGDGCGVFLGKGGISHGRGMKSSKEGTVFLTGGNGILSGNWVVGTDVGKDRGSGTLIGLGVSSIGTGGSYCSIDKYSHQCCPQGTRGSGSDAIRRGGSSYGGIG